MASGWVKTFQCKSRAFEDVYHLNPKPNPVTNSGCRQSIRDVIDATKHLHPHHNYNKPRKSRPSQPPSPPPPEKPTSKHPRTGKSTSATNPSTRSRTSTSTRPSRSLDPFFPALAELPEGHLSRNVVEIIFHTSWSPKAFTGRIEMIFKVENGSKTVTRFEEYREMVKQNAGSDGPTGGTTWEENARCVADGNEVMRFHCMGTTTGMTAYVAGRIGSWAFPGGKGSAICTFTGSGGAHESAGGGRGRRAMLVCRVIAGRVSKQLGIDSLIDGRVGFDSVSGEKDKLLVFDSRAVLPCFLIIYKL